MLSVTVFDVDQNPESVDQFVSPPFAIFPTKRARLQEDGDWSQYVETMPLQNETVRQALRSLRRETFVPSRFLHLAYQHTPIPLGFNRRMESPFDYARLIDLAEVAPSERLLEVGTGTGYQTALISMVYPSSFVTIDDNEAFVEEAIDRFHGEWNMPHISILHADDPRWAESADEYDVILYSRINPFASGEMLTRLAMNGRLLMPYENPMTGEVHVLRISKTPACIVQELL